MSTTATRVTRPACGIGRPSSAASRFSTAISAILARVRRVAEPRCGTTSRLGASSSGSSPGSGSGSVTSSAAPRDPAFDQRLPQRVLVDDPAAGGVDEQRGRLHARERARVDQVPGVGRERRVEGDDVGALEQLAEREAGRARAVDDLHPEAGGAARDGVADPAAADDAERGARRGRCRDRRPGPTCATRPRGPSRRRTRSRARARGSARTRGRRSRRSARRACCRPGCRARPPRRGRCCRSRPRSWRSRAGWARRRAAPRRCGRLTIASSPSASRVRARSSSGGGASSPGHVSTSCSASSRSSAGKGSSRVTNTRAIDGHSGWHGRDSRRLLGLELRRLARACVPEGHARARAGSSTTRRCSTPSRSTPPSTGWPSRRR